MINITGDCHGMFNKFGNDIFPEQKTMTKKDVVIIAGDYGGVWEKEETKHEKYWFDWFESRNFTTLIVTGNHENYDRINKLPTQEWNGGIVGVIRPSVLVAGRGEIFDIDGVKVFTFGGARSHDISDGILDENDIRWKEKAAFLDSRGKHMYRVKGISWWEEELPSEDELTHARNVLAAHDNKVDLIVTHCAPSSIQSQFLPYGSYDILTDFLNEVKHTVEYKQWFFGHYHFNAPIDEKHGCLYQYILPWNNEREIIDNCLLYK